MGKQLSQSLLTTVPTPDSRGKNPLSKQTSKGAAILQGVQNRFLLSEHGSISLKPVAVMGCWEWAWSTGLVRILTSDEEMGQLWENLSSHNNAQPWCSQCLQPPCQRQGKVMHNNSWTEPPPEFIFKYGFIHFCVVYFPLSVSAILGSDSIRGNSTIISGSGSKFVLWLRLWKLLLSKLLADLPVLFWAGVKRAWWDIEPFTNHKSGKNNRTFTVGF